MDRVTLIKWDDEDAKGAGWDGLEDLANDVGYPVDDIKAFWWYEDEEADVIGTSGVLKDVTAHAIIHGRVYPTTVKAVIISETEKEMIIEVTDSSVFL